MVAMNALAGFEIYIPAEAEVKLVPLWSLPNHTLRRLGLAQSGDLKDSPKATWISPAVIRERGKFNCARDTARVNMELLRMNGLEAAQGPFQMPFVSSNYTAYKVLSKFLPAGRILSRLTHTPRLPNGSPASTHQGAVVIYSGRIYVSIRKPKLVRGRGETHKSKPVGPAQATPSQQSPAVPSPEEDEFEKVWRRTLKRQCLTHQAKVMLPKLSEDLENLLHSTREPQDTQPASKRNRSQDEDQSVNREAVAPSSNSALVSETEEEDASEEPAIEQVSDDAGRWQSRGEEQSVNRETGAPSSNSALVSETEEEDASEGRAIEQVSDDAGRWQSRGEEQSVNRETGAPSSNSALVSETEEEDTSEERAIEQVSYDAGRWQSRGEEQSVNRETGVPSSNSALVSETEEEDASEEQAMEQVSDDAGRWQSGGEEAEDGEVGDDASDGETHQEAKTIYDDRYKGDNVFGVTEDSVALTHMPSFTSDFDFDQLAQEELINCMKAQLRESEAALKKLC